jgi:hypothetical protein
LGAKNQIIWKNYVVSLILKFSSNTIERGLRTTSTNIFLMNVSATSYTTTTTAPVIVFSNLAHFDVRYIVFFTLLTSF